jgi:hypothetical protein
MKTRLLIKDNEYLDIDVGHVNGGMNYFSGRVESKGIEVYFTKVKLSDDMKSYEFSPHDKENFRIKVASYKRKSQKKLDQVFQFVKDNQDSLLQLWVNGLYDRIMIKFANNL